MRTIILRSPLTWSAKVQTGYKESSHSWKMILLLMPYYEWWVNMIIRAYLSDYSLKHATHRALVIANWKGRNFTQEKKDVDDRIFKVKQTHNNNLWNAINGYPGANSGGLRVDGMVNSLINSWTCRRDYCRTIRFPVTTLWFCRNITKQWNNNFWKIIIIITGISQLIIYFPPYGES